MILKIILILTMSAMTSGCLLTAALVQKAEPRYEEYLVSKVTKAFKSDSYIFICFEGKSKNRGVNRNLSQNYVISFNVNDLNKGKRNNEIYEVTRTECETFSNDINNRQTTPFYSVDRNVECSVDKECKTFTWELATTDKVILRGEYEKNAGRYDYSLHTNKLLHKLKSLHKVNEAIYDIKGRGVRTTRDKNPPHSIYYMNQDIPVHYWGAHYINIENVPYDKNTYLYTLMPVTVALDIVTFPIQLFAVIFGGALDAPYN